MHPELQNTPQSSRTSSKWASRTQGNPNNPIVGTGSMSYYTYGSSKLVPKIPSWRSLAVHNVGPPLFYSSSTSCLVTVDDVYRQSRSSGSSLLSQLLKGP